MKAAIVAATMIGCLALSGCAAVPKPTRAPAASKPPVADTIYSMAAVPEDLSRYSAVDLDDSRLHVSSKTLAVPDGRHSWIPRTGAIHDRTWQLARRRDGQTIDACVDQFEALRAQMLRTLEGTRGR